MGNNWELKNWGKMKIYDLSIPISHLTPPWPTYEPLQIRFFKRLAPNGANGQLLTHSNHVGTHLDGPLHFCTHGRDIASLPLQNYLVGPGVVVDISDIAEDYGIYTSKDLMERADIRKGDIVIINTGYHKYGFDQPGADEVRYMVRHPGPTKEFSKWCMEMQLKWLAVDCGSADHPMNTKIREWMPAEAKLADAHLKKKYGRGLDEFFPPEDYQLMHVDLFPHEIIHMECAGGDIDKLSGKRATIGCFPWRFEGGESCISRLVAFVEED